MPFTAEVDYEAGATLLKGKKMSYAEYMENEPDLNPLLEAAAPQPTADLLMAKGLGKSYGLRQVLRQVDLTLPSGSLTLICGPNGAGKSTLLRILAGLAAPDTGLIHLNVPPEDLGFLTHESGAYTGLTALENLTFWTKLHGLELTRADLENLLAEAGLAAFAHEPAAAFSQGMLQRLNLARCFAPRPRLLLLDEPAGSLDRAGLNLLKERLAAARSRGGAVALASHQLHDFLPAADFVLALTPLGIDAESEETASSIAYYGPASTFTPEARAGGGHA